MPGLNTVERENVTRIIADLTKRVKVLETTSLSSFSKVFSNRIFMGNVFHQTEAVEADVFVATDSFVFGDLEVPIDHTIEIDSGVTLEIIPIITELSPMVTCQLRKSASQSIPDSTYTTLSWNTETFDDYNMHILEDDDRIYVPFTGDYLINVRINWLDNGTGIRLIRINRNGSELHHEQTYRPVTYSHATSTQCRVRLNAGDFLQVAVWQNSTITLSVNDDLSDSRDCVVTVDYLGNGVLN